MRATAIVLTLGLLIPSESAHAQRAEPTLARANDSLGVAQRHPGRVGVTVGRVGVSLLGTVVGSAVFGALAAAAMPECFDCDIGGVVVPTLMLGGVSGAILSSSAIPRSGCSFSQRLRGSLIGSAIGSLTGALIGTAVAQEHPDGALVGMYFGTAVGAPLGAERCVATVSRRSTQ
jgi:hypothetical protein